jgi:hypothetical protein
MKIVKQDLWMDCSMHIVTTNATLHIGDRLVMGRGAALEARHHIDLNIDLVCGERIKSLNAVDGKYGFQTILPYFGIFQVKKNWRDNAEFELIRYSAHLLASYANFHEKLTFRLNFPGIGAGRLMFDDVVGLLEILPNNVTVCMK